MSSHNMKGTHKSRREHSTFDDSKRVICFWSCEGCIQFMWNIQPVIILLSELFSFMYLLFIYLQMFVSQGEIIYFTKLLKYHPGSNRWNWFKFMFVLDILSYIITFVQVFLHYFDFLYRDLEKNNTRCIEV